MSRSLAKVYCGELEGIDAKLIEVEVDINVGIHSFGIVGLADKALNEAKERVSAALKNSGIKPPSRENRKIVVNLAPADVKKTGSQYDLAIAVAYLLATNQILPFETGDKIFLGELAFDGRLRPIRGALSIAQMASESGFSTILLPRENVNEAAAISSISVIGVESLEGVIAFLENKKEIFPAKFSREESDFDTTHDFSEIHSQENAKRALMIAAAGGHNILMSGPPGVGKSFLAHAMAGILPEMSLPESIEVAKIWSAAGMGIKGLVRIRPFRSPHHTASAIAIIGGGQDPRPGEISLAHYGILFLDELPEFQKHTVESLRQPMESGLVHIARARQSVVFPSRFTLVAAMNPCPCGYYGDDTRECRCMPHEVLKYQKRISGPLLDRIDLQVRVGRVAIRELRLLPKAELANPPLRARVERARRIQHKRFEGMDIVTNAEMSAKQAGTEAKLDRSAEKILEATNLSQLSPRGYYKILKVARTIADLEESERITEAHLTEAFSYRLRDTSAGF